MSTLLLRLLPSWWARAAVAALGVLAVGLAGFAKGVGHERAKWEAAQVRQERDYLAAVVRAGQVADRIVTEYVIREREVVRQGETIVREVPVYVTAQADARCVVPRGFVRVHNAAVANQPLPGAAGGADAAPAGIALSAVTGTVALNYAEFHAMKAQLVALQAWARESRSAPGDR